MTWIKRNLWFLVGLLVAVALMGAGGYYFYTEYQEEGKLASDMREQSDLLKTLSNEKPNPGKSEAGNVDNVAAAKEQTRTALALAENLRAGFQPVRPVERSANFQHQLDTAVSEMKAAAQEAGVSLPTDYHFTFQTESKMLNLPSQALPELATHVSAIRAICQILFNAKVNKLGDLKRPAVAGIETNGPDFLPPPAAPAANALANMTPYKVTFFCFSRELGAVMAGLANSPNGFIVKYMDVEPGVDASAAAPAPAARGRPATFLNEKLLAVTLLIEVVQPITAK